MKKTKMTLTMIIFLSCTVQANIVVRSLQDSAEEYHRVLQMNPNQKSPVQYFEEQFANPTLPTKYDFFFAESTLVTEKVRKEMQLSLAQEFASVSVRKTLLKLLQNENSRQAAIHNLSYSLGETMNISHNLSMPEGLAIRDQFLKIKSHSNFADLKIFWNGIDFQTVDLEQVYWNEKAHWLVASSAFLPLSFHGTAQEFFHVFSEHKFTSFFSDDCALKNSSEFYHFANQAVQPFNEKCQVGSAQPFHPAFKSTFFKEEKSQLSWGWTVAATLLVGLVIQHNLKDKVIVFTF